MDIKAFERNISNIKFAKNVLKYDLNKKKPK